MSELSNELLIGASNEALGVVVQLSNKLWGIWIQTGLCNRLLHYYGHWDEKAKKGI
ncbi:hypothetical protein [Vibrio parahaemolyticus]|uniref:hypothetical protein n=1 Tax=Vibrio parahaemolyticus TaxID=670 RepID=UPI0015DE6B2A|nr:hypothetical protein [Vibrio parahaemolyticus]